MAVALRRRVEETQGKLWVATDAIAKAPGHVFYERLNGLLRGAGFDLFVEELVAPFYADTGRPGIVPGVYFRMLFVAYFEGIDSQRGIVWPCEDSLSLRNFLRLQPPVDGQAARNASRGAEQSVPACDADVVPSSKSLLARLARKLHNRWLRFSKAGHQAYGFRDLEYFALKLYALHLAKFELIG
jgi:hypothetical protein